MRMASASSVWNWGICFSASGSQIGRITPPKRSLDIEAGNGYHAGGGAYRIISMFSVVGTRRSRAGSYNAVAN